MVELAPSYHTDTMYAAPNPTLKASISKSPPLPKRQFLQRVWWQYYRNISLTPWLHLTGTGAGTGTGTTGTGPVWMWSVVAVQYTQTVDTRHAPQLMRKAPNGTST